MNICGTITFNNEFQKFIWETYIYKETLKGGIWFESFQPSKLWFSLKVKVNKDCEVNTRLEGWSSKSFYNPTSKQFYDKYKKEIICIKNIANNQKISYIDALDVYNSGCETNIENKYKATDLRVDLEYVKNAQKNWNTY